MRNHSRNAGFTLVELLIVITVIGILAASVIPIMKIFRERGAEAAGLASTCCIRNAFENFYSKQQRYPEAFGSHNELVNFVLAEGCVLRRDDVILPAGSPILQSYTCRNYAIDTVNGGWTDLGCGGAVAKSPDYEAIFDLSGIPGKQTVISSIDTCKVLDPNGKQLQVASLEP